MLPRLYPILDIDLCRERRLEPLAVLAAFLAGGATLLQLRDKSLSNADGVHVGQEDLAVEEARRILGPDAVVGVSTHDEGQIEAAARTTATYIAVGPIYGTATKDTGYSARGLDLVRRAARTGRPV